jgi:hypothetical protein
VISRNQNESLHPPEEHVPSGHLTVLAARQLVAGPLLRPSTLSIEGSIQHPNACQHSIRTREKQAQQQPARLSDPEAVAPNAPALQRAAHKDLLGLARIA